MPTRRLESEARRRSSTVRRRLTDDLVRLCADAGVSARALARAADLDHGYVAAILRGDVKPTVETYARLAIPLGADLSARLYPNTGPVIRDRHQARMLEWLLEQLHPRWRPFTEVAVRKPVRGWIDALLHDARAGLVVATEIESDLRRLEQQVRWSGEKATALPSWPGWTGLGDEPEISRLLLVRRTRATRGVATEFARQLAVAYPAHPDDAMAALSSAARWPGPAMVWVSLEPHRVRFVAGR